MKIQTILAAIIVVASLPAMATKARLIALGEEVTGSQYINDSRNVFLNAASVNDYKNMAVFEWGSNGAPYNPAATPATVRKQDVDNNAQAEGGIFQAWNDMVIGLYVGGETAQSHEARRYLNLQNNIVHQDNQIDLFIGGQAAVKWGANVTYSKVKDDSIDAKGQSASVRLGAMASNWEGFANVSVANKFEGDLNSSGTDEEFDGKLGYEIGGTYHTGKGKVFAFWRHSGWDQKSDNAISAAAGAANGGVYLGEAEVSTDRYILGYGNEDKVTSKATIFYKVSYVKNDHMFDTKTEGKAELNDYMVPVTVGLEHDSTEWLRLRGSITQNLVGQADNDYDATLTGKVSALVTTPNAQGKRTIPNSTNVNAGATLKFGDFNIDGVVGVDGGTTGTETGIFSTDNLMSRVAMTYKW